MIPILFIVSLITVGALQFWFFQRKRIYRAKTLDRGELNRMHRHTAFTALLCLAMIVVGWWFPDVRFAFVLSAAMMLIFVLPLRTLMIENGVRYRHSGTPPTARDPVGGKNDG